MSLDLLKRLDEIHDKGGWDAVRTWLQNNIRGVAVQQTVPASVADDLPLVKRLRRTALVDIAPNLIPYTRTMLTQVSKDAPDDRKRLVVEFVFFAPKYTEESQDAAKAGKETEKGNVKSISKARKTRRR